jgi:hypothetical protein
MSKRLKSARSPDSSGSAFDRSVRAHQEQLSALRVRLPAESGQ